jgi:uncharacterized protein
MKKEGSRFNIFVRLDDDEYLLYNTLTHASSLIPVSLVKCFGWNTTTGSGLHRSLKGNGPGIHQNLPILSNFPNSLLDVMTEKGFIVSDIHEDYERLDKFLKTGYNPDTFYPVIAYTSRCDLACSYCFEEGINRNTQQSEYTIEKTLFWIEKYLKDKGPFKGVNLGLFGGEPLLDIKMGQQFIDGVKEISNSYGINFDFGVTTNGTHLKRDLIEKWYKDGLNYVRVTLDGPRNIHDARRFKLSGKGTYDLILNNLVEISDIDGIRIGIEINIDNQNAYCLDGLLDDIEKFGLKHRVELTPEQTLETLTSSCGSGDSTKAHHCNKHCLEGSKLSKAFVYVVDRIIERGFSLPEFIGVYYPCVFVQKHHLVIDWSGDMYKCSFTMGNKEMCVGNVSDGLNAKNEDMLGAKDVIDYCKNRECAYIPICGGGCRYESWNKTGSFIEVNCKADLIDAISPKTLKAFFT